MSSWHSKTSRLERNCSSFLEYYTKVLPEAPRKVSRNFSYEATLRNHIMSWVPIGFCCPRPEGWRPEVRGGEFERRSAGTAGPCYSSSPVPPKMYTFAWRTWPGPEPGEKLVLLAMLCCCVCVWQEGGALNQSTLFTPETVQPLSHYGKLHQWRVRSGSSPHWVSSQPLGPPSMGPHLILPGERASYRLAARRIRRGLGPGV